MALLVVFACMLLGAYLAYWAIRQGVRDALRDTDERRAEEARERLAAGE